ncbi:hypothetical protein L6164_001252 [Bauhinia variegata]|uniref:Uncharacterized protein n=1 Tax=Bauhinia variegata TaxID=167791 RepID=A0ACB9Q929_BAUVA|nr:hypothetical protein L6164_001252 [Bauhinia variegata]
MFLYLSIVIISIGTKASEPSAMVEPNVKEVQQKMVEIEGRLDGIDKKLEDLQRISRMEAEMQMMKDALTDILEQLKSENKGKRVLRDEVSSMRHGDAANDHNLLGPKQGENEGLAMRTMYDGLRLPFPIFDGFNFRQWRGKCEQYFQLAEVSDAQKVKMILLCMEGKAFSWQQHYMQEHEGNRLHWKQLIIDMATRFDKALFDDPFSKSLNLKQTGSIDEYLEMFDDLVIQAGVDGSVTRSCFINGLRGPLDTTIRIHHPRSLNEALHVARLRDEFLSQLASQPYIVNPKPLPTNSFPKQSYNNPSYSKGPAQDSILINHRTPIHNSKTTFSTLQSQPSQSSTSVTKPRTPQIFNQHTQIFKPANQATKDERRVEGLCILCGEKWYPGHRASCRVISRVNAIVLEAVEMYELVDVVLEATLEDSSPSDEEINISVNAVRGLGGNHTMYLQATIKKQDIAMLVDSGSTPNFLSEALVKKLGLSTQYIGSHYATVANASLMEINYKCFMVKWVVQQHEFQCDFYVLPGHKFGAILGMNWLKSLKRVQYDYEELTIQFQYKAFNNPCVTSDSVVEAVNVVNRSRQQISTLLQHNLSKAHNRMKFYADKKRSERHFEVGDFVYLKLQPYRQSSVANTPFHKLVARYYGPYEILEKVGAVAYKLALPTRSKIHNVFHVSLLKKHKGDRPTSITLSPFQDDGSLPLVLFAIISRRMHKRNNRVVTQVLVQWLHTRPEDAVWMDLDGFV